VGKIPQRAVSVPRILFDQIEEAAHKEYRDVSNMVRILLMEALDRRAERGALFHPQSIRKIGEMGRCEKALPDDCELREMLVEGKKMYVAVCGRDAPAHRFTLKDGTACFGYWPTLAKTRLDLEGVRKHRSPRLREKDVVIIRQRLDQGEAMAAIAETFGVSRDAIRDIKRGRTWKSVMEE
jgi:Arc/MetJ-type ribon-helix-helix transcriptional regulator